MKPTFNIILLILAAITLSAQKYDYNWYTGYVSSKDKYYFPYGIMHWQFNTASGNPMFTLDSFKNIEFERNLNNVSDRDGNFLFNFNGGYLENYKNKPIPNGRLNSFDYLGQFSQMSVVLPSSNSDEYNIFYKTAYVYGKFVGSQNILASTININRLSEGVVKSKAQIIASDTFHVKGINAVQHANGYDWWLLDFEELNASYYNILMRNLIILNTTYLNSGLYFHNTINQLIFSPNGEYLAVSSAHPYVDSLEETISLFKFNRATGQLTALKYFKYFDEVGYDVVGVAFSPNSKLLYISRKKEILQVDLSDSTLSTQVVAEYDGFVGNVTGNLVASTYFGFMQKAPDGRIYGTTSSTRQRYLFYINKPNIKGIACDVRQHAIEISLHANIPTFPNYRLGPIDGSESDSLGIDNIPVAEFRYDQDTMNYHSIDFTNLSWYEPEEFWWDWGDGSQPYYTTVWDTSIIHTYAKDGIYEVCLRAKNKNGESTKCKKINIGTTATKDEADNPLINITLSPNPMREILIIQVNDYLPEKMIMNLYDLQGNKITTKRLYEGSNIINTESLSSGVYVAEIIERNRIIKSEKIVKN